MSNIVEIILGLKDLLSPAMSKAAQISKDANSTITTSNIAATVAVHDLGKAVAEMGNEYKRLSNLPKDVNMSLPKPPVAINSNDITTMGSKVNSVLDGIKNKIKGAGKDTKAMGDDAAIAGKKGAKGLAGLAWEAFTTTKNLSGAQSKIKEFMGGAAALEIVQQATGMSTEMWGYAQYVLNGIMDANPIGLIIIGVTALVMWVKHITNHNKYWAQALKDLWGVIKAFAHSQMTTWKMIGETIWYWIRYAWLKIEGFIDWSQQAFARLGKSMKLALSGDFEGAKAVYDVEIKTKNESDLAKLTQEHGLNQSGYLADYSKDIKTINDGLKSAGTNIFDGIDKRNDPGTDPTKDVKDIKDKTTKNKPVPAMPTKSAHVMKGSTSAATAKADSITSGGSKSVVINIHEVGNDMKVYVSGAKEAGIEVADKIRQEVMRIFGTAAHAAF